MYVFQLFGKRQAVLPHSLSPMQISRLRRIIRIMVDIRTRMFNNWCVDLTCLSIILFIRSRKQTFVNIFQGSSMLFFTVESIITSVFIWSINRHLPELFIDGRARVVLQQIKLIHGQRWNYFRRATSRKKRNDVTIWCGCCRNRKRRETRVEIALLHFLGVCDE